MYSSTITPKVEKFEVTLHSKFLPDMKAIIANTEKENGEEDAAMDLLSEDFGVLEAKVMGATGAMNRGVPKSEALKKYGLTDQEYNEGYYRVFPDDEL